MKVIHISPQEDICIVCGTPIPEGRQICPNCEREAEKYDQPYEKPSIRERISALFQKLHKRKQ